MIISKQQAFLRFIANPLDTILIVGKDGMNDDIMRQAGGALAARELIRGKVLETAGITARQATDELAAPFSAEVVQIIGGRFVLYCRNRKKPRVIPPRPAKK